MKRLIAGLENKFALPLLTLFLIIAGYLYLRMVGNTYTMKLEVDTWQQPALGNMEEKEVPQDAYKVWVWEDSKGSVEILDFKGQKDVIEIKVRSQKPGRVYLAYQFYDLEYLKILYVHPDGLLTCDDYFGDCNGSRELRVLWVLYLAFLIMRIVRKYRLSVRRNRYLYKNILYCGLIFFLVYIFVFQVFRLLARHGGAIDVLSGLMFDLLGFGFVAFLPMMLVSIMVMISNIKLVRKEGRNWRNLLGTMLGFAMLIACITPEFVSGILQSSTFIDVHNWRGTGRFVGMFIENFASACVAYLTCILLGTITLSISAARHIPAFDQDYILIHGCMIKKDGTLTKLLQSRADRALEFARMQKEATGKEIIFVPSGGQGSDEIISEAEAIRRYLKEQGVPDEQILMEDQSTNTLENLKNSAKLIREQSNSKEKEPKIVFATTNYHVFRAGLLATELGIRAEGIGSKTKSYFWINAFVREFIATLYSERMTHILVLGILTLINLAMVVMTYISNVVLS